MGYGRNAISGSGIVDLDLRVLKMIPCRHESQSVKRGHPSRLIT